LRLFTRVVFVSIGVVLGQQGWAGCLPVWWLYVRALGHLPTNIELHTGRQLSPSLSAVQGTDTDVPLVGVAFYT